MQNDFGNVRCRRYSYSIGVNSARKLGVGSGEWGVLIRLKSQFANRWVIAWFFEDSISKMTSEMLRTECLVIQLV